MLVKDWPTFGSILNILNCWSKFDQQKLEQQLVYKTLIKSWAKLDQQISKTVCPTRYAKRIAQLFCSGVLIKESQLSTLCPYVIVSCYLEFKLNNLKLLSIRVNKNVFEKKKKKDNEFLLFRKVLSKSIFSRNRSLGNPMWSYGKNMQI